MSKKVPKKVPKYVEDLVTAFESMIDVQRFDVFYTLHDSDKDDCAASIDIDFDYRRLNIHIYPCFWGAIRKYQRAYLLHEFSHVITHRYVDLLDDFINGKLVTKHQVKSACESGTSLIAEILDTFLQGGMRKQRKEYAKFLTAGVRTIPKKAKTRKKRR